MAFACEWQELAYMIFHMIGSTMAQHPRLYCQTEFKAACLHMACGQASGFGKIYTRQHASACRQVINGGKLHTQTNQQVWQEYIHSKQQTADKPANCRQASSCVEDSTCRQASSSVARAGQQQLIILLCHPCRLLAASWPSPCSMPALLHSSASYTDAHA